MNRYAIAIYIIIILAAGFALGVSTNVNINTPMSDEQVYNEMLEDVNWIIFTQGDMKLSEFTVHANNHKHGIMVRIHDTKNKVCNSIN